MHPSWQESRSMTRAEVEATLKPLSGSSSCWPKFVAPERAHTWKIFSDCGNRSQHGKYWNGCHCKMKLHADKVLLEPLSEYFIIQPGQRIFICAVFDERTVNTSFTIDKRWIYHNICAR